MTKELKKRIITSFLLFLLAVYCIFINYAIFLIAIFLVSGLAFYEISLITYRIIGYSFLLGLLCLLYVFGIFAFTAAGLYLLLGPVFFLYILSICICSDIGGYIIGKKIGGKKLTKISPNKTISGSICSFCFSMAPFLVFYNFDKSEYSYSINNFLLCLGVSLVCQLGDIFISYLKRKARVKDTGRILPGHGGILDRIDGIIFAIPFAYIYRIGLINYFEIWIEIIPNAFKNL